MPEGTLRELLERTPAYVYLKDAELRHVYANRKLLDWFDVSLEEFRGTTAADFFPPHVAARLEEADRRSMSGAVPPTPERLHLEADRGEEWLLDLKYPLHGPDGPMLAGIAIDIAGQVAAERELSELLDFERCVGTLSHRLAIASIAGIDAAIADGLGALATHLGAERAFLGRLRDGRLYFGHRWLHPDLTPAQRSYVEDVDPADAPFAVGRSVAGETVAFSSAADFPPEATFERQYLDRHGIRSGLFSPGRVADEVVGVLVLDCLVESRRWPAALLERLALPVDLLCNALLRTESTALIEELHGFESTVADISGLLAEAEPASVDVSVDACLERLGTFLGVDRAFVARFTGGGAHLRATNTWAAEGANLDSTIFSADLATELPWVAKQFREGKTVLVDPAYANLPEEASGLRGFLERDGISSAVVVPVLSEGEPIGILGVDTLENPRDYPEEIVNRLRHVAHVIASTLGRCRAEVALRESLTQVERLRDRLANENVYLREEVRQAHPAHEIVGENQVLLEVLDQARQVATTESTVLILGETGTGKELLARFVHEASPRSDRTLVKVNCATLPASLVESELFGRERGAYTGAMARQTGRFEIADGSTILLDEIGELTPETQVKLLRVVEEGEFERLGSSKTLKVDVRVIAATNRDLAQDVADGRFREDLYYRLNVFPLTLAPLRERPDDIPLLTWHFIERFAGAMAKPMESIDRATLKAFSSYAWPGNVRELKNVIERGMILTSGPVFKAELPSLATPEGGDGAGDDSLDGAQRRQILKVMERTNWRVRGAGGAAELLRIKPSTLENRMKKLGIRRPR